MFWKWKKKKNSDDELLILYGTRSGNSRLVAKQAEQFYRKNGVKATCANMSKYNPEQLQEVKRLLAVVSTHGEGEPPDQAQKFFLKIMGNEIGNLSQLKYSVCALGDSAYEQYCKAGKDLEERLNQLGAKTILPRKDCDVEFSEDASKWIKESFKVLTSKNGHPTNATETLEFNNEIKNRPRFSAKITGKKKLTADSAQSPVYHISLKVESEGFSYEAGDSIEIFPRNPEWLAGKILEQVQINSIESNSGPELELMNFLLEKAEITRLNAGTVKRCQELANHEQLEKLINDKPAFTEYLGQANLLDLLLDFPCSLTAGQLMTIPTKLTPRVYSIASGPRLNPGTIDLTVKTIRYQFKNFPHEGSGSVFINEDLQSGSTLEFSLEENPEFRLPENTQIPVVMIGVGTGIAPFRAFLQERSALAAKNGTWLIWGAKKQASDSLYKEELEAFKNDQTLERLDTAFSKDDNPRKYVQDILNENKTELVNWLEREAHIYVCGSIAMGRELKTV
jgi:sulfite reductase (NADPH) flavoprotein alpha-component